MLRLVAEHHGGPGRVAIYERFLPLSPSSVIDFEQSKSFFGKVRVGKRIFVRWKKTSIAHVKLKLCFAIPGSHNFSVTDFSFAILRSLNASGSLFFYSIELAFHLIKFPFMNQKFFFLLLIFHRRVGIFASSCRDCSVWIRWKRCISMVNRLSSWIGSCGNVIASMESWISREKCSRRRRATSAQIERTAERLDENVPSRLIILASEEFWSAQSDLKLIIATGSRSRFHVSHSPGAFLRARPDRQLMSNFCARNAEAKPWNNFKVKLLLSN